MLAFKTAMPGGRAILAAARGSCARTAHVASSVLGYTRLQARIAPVPSQPRMFHITAVTRSSGAGVPFDAPFLAASHSGLSESQMDVREAIRAISSQFPNEYWRDCDKHGRYPHELYDALSEGQWLGICLPQEYGGAGLGISEAAIMLQTIAESGGGGECG